MCRRAGKGFIYFITLRLISQGECTLWIQKKKKQLSLCAWRDCSWLNQQTQFDWFARFDFTVIGGNVDRLSCQVCSLQRPEDHFSKCFCNYVVRKVDSRRKCLVFLGVLWRNENEITAMKVWLRKNGGDIERWTRMELILLLNQATSFKIASNSSSADWNYLSRIIQKGLSVWSMWGTWQKPVQPNTNGFYGIAVVWFFFNFSCFHEKSPQRTEQFRRLHVFKSLLEPLFFSPR